METFAQNHTVVDFNHQSSANSWKTVDDVVMGGKSDGHFKINGDGHGEFYGHVSLENNGGFSSVRHRAKFGDIDNYQLISIRLKGDGKSYQFRVKNDQTNEYSYVSEFQTSGDWETVTISLKDMYPVYRGNRLRKPNFHHNEIEEIGFLIANKREEDFKLEIDRIELIR